MTTRTDNDMSPTPERRVSELMDSLEDNVAALDEAFTRLDERIHTALVPATNQKGDISGDEASCELGQRVLMAVRRLELLRHRVGDMADRVRL